MQSLSLGTCRSHGKKLFRTRKVARHHARRIHPGAQLSPYPCTVHEGLWHLGNLPEVIVRGWKARATIEDHRIEDRHDPESE